MTFGPRYSPARCRMLVQGRARVAIMVSGACLLGGTAGLLEPALAQSKPASAETFDSSEPDVSGGAPADEFDSSEPVPVAPTDVKETIRPVETQAGGGFDSADPQEPPPAAAGEDGDARTTTTPRSRSHPSVRRTRRASRPRRRRPSAARYSPPTRPTPRCPRRGRASPR